MRNILFTTLIRFWRRNCTVFRRARKGYGISIIIPFRRSKKYQRQDKNFQWVQKYWKCQLPGAELIVGKDRGRGKAFSKSAAINNGVAESTGDILVIVDVDCFIDADVVLGCAEEIRRARCRRQRLWFIPYRKFFRLTDAASQRVLDSKPCYPYSFPTPPKQTDEDSTGYGHHNRHHRWSGSRRGHWYGAMIQIMPTEAFEEVGGWDTRFCGWGGEDHSAMRCMDTLYWRHKTTPNQVLHLWHPMMSKEGTQHWVAWSDRLWEGQPRAGTNGRLAARYSTAFGNIAKMRALLEEGRGKR